MALSDEECWKIWDAAEFGKRGESAICTALRAAYAAGAASAAVPREPDADKLIAMRERFGWLRVEPTGNIYKTMISIAEAMTDAAPSPATGETKP